MQGLSQLRRGRSLDTRAKRAKLRKRKPRFATDKQLRSAFRAAPRIARSQQPYLSTDTPVADLIA